MPRKTKNVRRARKNGGNRKQQRKTMRRKNVGGFSITDSFKRAQSLVEQGSNKAQSFINQGKELVKEGKEKVNTYVSDEKINMAISEINKKQGDERVNVLNQILNTDDINVFLNENPKIKTEIIRNGLDAFLNANPDAKNDIIRNGLTVELFKEILNKNTQHKFNSSLKQNIENKSFNTYWDSVLPQLGLKRKTGFFK